MNQRHKNANQSVGCAKKNPATINETACDKNHPNIIPLVKPSSSQYFEVYATDGINHEMRERYAEAIDYVNFCHRIMNRLLRKRCSESGDTEEYLHDFKIPETANFLSILDVLLHNSKKDVGHSGKLDKNNVPVTDDKLLNNPSQDKPCSSQTRPIKTLQSHRSQNYSPRNSPQTKILNNSYKKIVNKPANLAKTLLQNKIKQSNMGGADSSNNTPRVSIISHDGRNKPDTSDEHQGGCVNATSCDESNSVRTAKINTEAMGDPSAEKRLSSQIDANKCDVHENNADLDAYLKTIIQKQIQDFLKSTKNDPHATYVNDKRESLDIDNFRMSSTFGEVDLQNYSTYDEKTVRKELDQISKHVSPSASNESLSTCEYKQCHCNTVESKCSASQNETVASSISVKDIRKSKTNDYPLRRVDYTSPNIKISNIIENKRPVKRISTKPTLMNIDTNSETDDDNSTIASDEELSCVNCNSNLPKEFTPVNSKQDHMRNVEKVKNAFNIPKKHKTSVHVSKQNDPGEQKKFTHPLNINKQEIHNLDKNALSQMGLFTETGEIRADVLNLLQGQNKSKQNSERSSAFRKSRTNSDHVKKKHGEPVSTIEEAPSIGSLSCPSSSDIRSDM